MKYFFYIFSYLLLSCNIYPNDTKEFLDSEINTTSFFYNSFSFSKEKRAKDALNKLELINNTNLYSDSLINTALKYYQNKEKTLELSRTYYHLHLYYRNIGRQKESLSALAKSFENIPTLKDPLNKREYNFYGDLYYNLAENFALQEDFKQALFYYQESQKLYENANQQNKAVLSALFQSEIFMLTNEYDSAFYCINNAVTLIKDSSLMLPLLIKESQYYINIENYPAAKKKLDQANLYDLANYEEEYYCTKADFFIKNNHTDSARFYLSMIKCSNPKPFIEKKYLLSWINIYLLENNKEKANQYIYKLDSLYKKNQEIGKENSLQNFINQEKLEQANKNYQKLNKQQQFLLIVCSLLATLLVTFLCIYWYIIRKRKKELFESQLLIERLQIAEKEMNETSSHILNEKDIKLKNFFNDRIEIIKNFVETSRKYGNNLEKLKVKFNSLVSTESFTTSDWQLLREGVNITGYGLIDYLQEAYPTLTEENLRYCSLIYAGFETDELAILWDINNDSIYKKRTRLRQKLLLNKNQDIKKFFDEIIETKLKNKL